MFRYRCLVSAPTKYDAREFLLHLTRELCSAVLAVPEEELGYPINYPGLQRSLTGRRFAIPVVAAAGLWLVVDSFSNHLVATGAVILLSGALFAVALVLWDRERLGSRLALTVVLAVGPVGCALVLVGLFSPDMDAELLWGACFLYAALAAGAVIEVVRIARLDEPSAPGHHDVWDRARELSESTRYQMSFSNSTNTSVSVDMKPFGAEVGATRGITRSPLPQSLPEVVENFRSFVQLVSSPTARTLIVVDELDKMASPEDTGEFLNDIKGVFGLDNSVFVLGVSEDALASFERRGLQARDEMDSSFDDVVRIEPLTLAASISLLNQRVPRVPTPFWALCFALTGGLARDLIRTARSLFDYAADGTLHLASASEGLVCADVRARALGTLASMDAQVDARPDLASWALRVSEALDIADIQSRALEVPLGHAKPTVADDLAHRLCGQVYLGATAVDVFANRPFEDFEASLDPDSPRYLGSFGRARRLLPLSVDAAWVTIGDIRLQWGLTAWPSPRQAAAPATVERSIPHEA